MKIALYQCTEGVLLGWTNPYEVTDTREQRTDIVRSSEIVDIDFVMRPNEEIIPAIVDGIDQQMEEIRTKAMAEVAKLQARKAELLALTFEVAA
jgi:hypothetical protein